MIAKVIKSKDAFSKEEAIDIKGGLKKTFEVSECTCDCWISNKNEEDQTQNPKPIKR